MKKEYLKPEVSKISLLIPEKIATALIDDEGGADGEAGMESSIW